MKVTQAELARKLEVSRQRVHKMIREGLVTADGFGKIDLNEAIKTIADNRDPARGGKNNATREGSFYEHRTAKEAALARLRELEVAEKEGILVNAEDLRHSLAKLFTGLKTRLRAIPSKCAPAIAHLKMENKSARELMAATQTLLLKDIDDALEEISHWELPRKGGR